jgi:hypothetical protein
MIGHHLSISALLKAASAACFCCSGGGFSLPRSVRRWRTAGSLKASTAAALSLATMALW